MDELTKIIAQMVGDKTLQEIKDRLPTLSELEPTYPYLSEAEIKKRYHVSTNTVNKWRALGLKGRKVGKSILYDIEDITTIIKLLPYYN